MASEPALFSALMTDEVPGHISGGDHLLRQLITRSSVEYTWNSSPLLRFLFPSVLHTLYKIRFLLAEVS